MSGQNNLTPAEWEHLRRTLEAAMHAVVISHPGGDTKERLAIMQGWADAPKMFPRNNFVMELFATMPDEMRKINEEKTTAGGNAEATISETVELCRKAAAIVAAKCPEQKEAYSKIVLYLANKVASAAKEGGFMGIGGKLVSDSEKAVLDRIAQVL